MSVRRVASKPPVQLSAVASSRPLESARSSTACASDLASLDIACPKSVSATFGAFASSATRKRPPAAASSQYHQISSADSSIPPDCDRDPRPAGANDPAAVHAGHPCGHRFRLADDCDRFADYSSTSSLSAPQMGQETDGGLSYLFRANGWVEQLTRQAASSALQSSAASPQGNPKA